MPLTETVTFKARLQCHNRVVVPRHVRWRYKMEAGELLKVNVKPFNGDSFEEERFIAKMATDGRLTIPKLTMQILQEREGKNLVKAILDIYNPTVSDGGTFTCSHQLVCFNFFKCYLGYALASRQRAKHGKN